jgi:2-aminoadipate transaminase
VLYRDRGDDRRDGSVSPGGLERGPDALPLGRAGQDRPPATPRRRSTARDIERYASLFAQRTKVMRSSAMRDLMALTS